MLSGVSTLAGEGAVRPCPMALAWLLHASPARHGSKVQCAGSTASDWALNRHRHSKSPHYHKGSWIALLVADSNAPKSEQMHQIVLLSCMTRRHGP